jgi:hypothetical protein
MIRKPDEDPTTRNPEHERSCQRPDEDLLHTIRTVATEHKKGRRVIMGELQALL